MPFSLVLASTSTYKQSILEKLHLPFEVDKPCTDETPRLNENPSELVKRLSFEKAKSLAQSHPNSLIIGADQVATHQGKIIGKSGGFDKSFAQLLSFSGDTVVFHTGLCLYNAQTQHAQIKDELFTVHFRKLSEDEITNYLHTEQPYDCAGSFKSEGFGITLFEKLEGDDPNALVGLPLIALGKMLRAEGISVL